MTMIAFIIMNSGLVFLIEGLCVQILYFKLEIICGLRKNPFKSTLAYDAVAAAVSHKHRSIICVGAGLIQFVYGSHSKLGNGAHYIKNSIFAIFSRDFQREEDTVAQQQLLSRSEVYRL